MAILNFLFGGIGIVGTLCGGAMYFIFINLPDTQPGQPEFPNAMKFLSKEIPGYTAYMTASMVVGFALATALVLAGIGLLGMRPWARATCIVYAVMTIIVQLVGFYYTMTYISPAMERWSQQIVRNLPPGMPNIGANPFFQNITAAMGLVFSVGYAVALLIIMFLPRVSAAFAGRSTAQAGREEDYYDPRPDDERGTSG